MRISRSALAAAILSSVVLSATCANAAVIFTFSQVGLDVVATASGTFDTSAAINTSSSNGLGKYEYPSVAFFGIGSGTSVDFYTTTGAPSSFSGGSGTFYYTSSSGTTIGMNGQAEDLFLDPDYVSNSAISATATWDNTTLSALGLDPAIYNFAAGGNPITLSIGQSTISAAPEPSTWLLMFAGIGGIGLMLRRAKKTMGFRFKDALNA